MNLDTIKSIVIFNNDLINIIGLGELFIKLILDLLVMFIIIKVIFYEKYKDRNYAFTNFAINISIFLMCFLLNNVQLELGFAFGLFAVFSILRYRTEPIPIRQMTYLFVSIIVAVFNALTNNGISYAEILLANGAIILVIYGMEQSIFHKNDQTKMVKYEKIELIKPENYDKLLKDISIRTGYKVKRAEIESINFLNDTAIIKIFYNEEDIYKDNESTK